MIELICIKNASFFEKGKKYRMEEKEDVYYYKKTKSSFTKEPDYKGRSYMDWFILEKEINIEAEDF